MSTPSIEVVGLRKTYGSTVALDSMSFALPPGRVTGFIGPNGAGKSTTMRVILGLAAPDAGRALVFGQPYQRLSHPLSHVGAVLDASALAPSRSARNHLLWLAQSQGMPVTRVDAVLDLVGLGTAARRRAGGYSLGMRQRLGIAAAMLGDPPVLMMDEPFNGMDPEGTLWLRGFLRSMATDGRVVLVSSHLMNEMQDIADHVVVVGRGKVIADESVAALLADAATGEVVLRTAVPDKAAEVLHHAGGHAQVTDHDRLRVTGLQPQHVVTVLGAANVPITEVTVQKATLEDVYLRLTGGEVDYRAGSQAVAR
ncbi:MAG TPA: ATP-binding cassette domain-containing protein [Pseudonocardiaceae bacterium]